MVIKSVPSKVFGSSRAPVKFMGKNDVFSRARNSRLLWAREVFGSFEKRTPGLSLLSQRVHNAINRYITLSTG